MSIASGVVFKTSEEVDFVRELAGWISPPAELPSESPAEDGTDAPPVVMQASAFQEECMALEARAEFEVLSTKLLISVRERFATESEQDVECAYAILLQLWTKWEMLPAKVLELADEFSSSVDERPLLRRTLLLSLYSLVQQYSLLDLRFPVLMKLLKFCTSAGLLDSILGGVAKRSSTIEQWIREWGLSGDQKKQLWGLVFDAYIEDSAATYEHALKYLTLHDASSLESQPKEVHERLVKSLLVTLRSPELFSCDKLAQLAIVQQLQSHDEYGLLYTLLQIFARQMYEDYMSFSAQPASKSFMEKHDISDEACARKMRLLSLVSLGQSHKELTYADIAAGLHITTDQVELWVMEAITSGLIAAKIDQVRELVIVTVCIEREFGDRQWERLKNSLGEWGKSVESLLQVVLDSRPTATP